VAKADSAYNTILTLIDYFAMMVTNLLNLALYLTAESIALFKACSLYKLPILNNLQGVRHARTIPQTC